ncbi:hypothetical protein [Pseudomonas sp. A34-9]|uniref:hypothetical protein n=1 Tax=Pseudomonas sp. A34-9 TaxID=3034675 RepID=UPI00240E0125|nr:hypothetical protein [Pseudomonas sp. A34-9]
MTSKSFITVLTIDASTELRVQNRKQFSSTETLHQLLGDRVTLKSSVNRSSQYSERSLVLTFREGVGSGTYTVGDINSPFSAINYVERGISSLAGGSAEIVYPAIEGSIKVEASPTADMTRYHFQLEVRVKHDISGTQLTVEGTSDVDLITTRFTP